MAEWWEEAFRADYLRVYPHRDDEEAALDLRLFRHKWRCLDEGRRVLDLACGAGRHLRAMEAGGVRPVGADLSRELLDEARGKGARELVRCDMRRLPFRTSVFDAVTMFFNSFGYFSSQEEDASVILEAARVLVAEGGFFLELVDPHQLLLALVPRSETKSGDVEVIEERSIVEDGRRVQKRVTLRRGREERAWTESVRLYSEAEIVGMAEGAGLSWRETARERRGSRGRQVHRLTFFFVKAAA